MFFFQDFFKIFENSILDYISSATADLISFLSPIITSLLIVYLALWGMAHLMGKINEPLKDGFSRIIKAIIVLSICLNVGLYNGKIVDFLYNGPDQIASVVSGTPPTSGSLDGLLEKGFYQADRAWDKAGVLSGNFGMYILWFVVIGLTLVVTAYAGFLIILSKAALTILLAIGPIFILLILFSATQKYFESWFSQVINYGIMVIVAVSLIKIMTTIFEAYINLAVADPDVNAVGTTYIAGAGIISLLVLRQVPQIAMALGGGISLASQGFISSVARKVFPSSGLVMSEKDRKLVRSVKSGASNLARKPFSSNSISG